MPEKLLKYRELRQIAKRYGIDEVPARGKGLAPNVHHCDRRPETKLPGDLSHEGHELSKSVVKAFRRAFDLTEDHGISDEEFYG